MASNRQWCVYSPLPGCCSLICARPPPHLHVDGSLVDAYIPSNRASECSLRRSAVNTHSNCTEPLRAAVYLSTRSPAERHVVLVSTFLHFPATDYAQRHKPQCYCLGC
jgi:hypothetical protein